MYSIHIIVYKYILYIIYTVYIFLTFFIKVFFLKVQVSLKKVIFIYRNVAKDLNAFIFDFLIFDFFMFIVVFCSILVQ